MVSPKNILTADEIARMERLEAIFSPHARRQREKKRKKDNPGIAVAADNRGRFSHYTSAEAALKIIASRRLWMRSTTCMADYSEVAHGYDLLLKYFRNEGRKAAFLAAADHVAQGVAKVAIELFDKWWDDIRVKTFIASVSEHDIASENNFGRLSMWRAFGAIQPRVAMVFSVPWYTQATQALGLLFSPVSYFSEEAAHAALDEVAANIQKESDFLGKLAPKEFESWIFQTLFSAVCCSKHEGFWEEREWRGVYTPALGFPSLLERATEIVGGVPQPIYKVPFDANASAVLTDLDMANILERIIIGPTQFGWVMYEAFVEALKSIGVPDPESRVWVSNLPIRG